ncbi:serine/threonine protein kinase [Spirulina sp. 06S082]|uniref:serine/threonine protein kinase n=1 Tax=Spirulina sp. 06S082 TaxID=3110248 RepID=UPI002B1F07FA|nr:serine/threonine protein kinase [Spirulina sp. 06S082]MEA5469005.1 serine/threonine protein kinase [Spirulina sp. 06S082]
MLGQILNERYQIISILGSGGFGRTYLARDTHHTDKILCTVKQLQPASRDPQAMAIAQQLFSQAAETLEQLGTHPQIPRLLSYFEASGDFFAVQDYVEGYPFSKEIIAGDRWSESQVFEFLREILPLLDFIHSQGVIHRDIKPDNILRRQQDNKLVLVDFGSLKQIYLQKTLPANTVETVAIGTPGYMAIEQRQGHYYLSSDIYSLGAIAIQALIGFHPQFFQYDTQTGEIIWPKNICSPAFAAVLSRMVAYRFQDRYQSAREVLKTIEQIQIPRSHTELPPIAPVSRYQLPLNSEAIASNSSPTPILRRRRVKKPPKSQKRQEKAQNSLGIFILLAFLVTVMFSFSFVVTLAVRKSPQSSVTRKTGPSQNKKAANVLETSATDKIPTNSCTVQSEFGLNIRTRPNGEKIGGMVRGERAILTGLEDGNWVEISNPIQGWVSKNYLQCASPSFIERASSPAKITGNEGEDILQAAFSLMETGDLQGAIALAEEIQTNSSAYRDAQNAIIQWRIVKERYEAMQQAKKSKRWEDIIADLKANGLPESDYWRNEFTELGKQAKLRR